MEMRYETHNINPAFDAIRNDYSKLYFDAWANGNTGFLLLMQRCVVLKTGYLNFRLRATVVFFIRIIMATLVACCKPFSKNVYRLYAWDTLSSNTNASRNHRNNAIRIYNPIKQLKKKTKMETL